MNDSIQRILETVLAGVILKMIEIAIEYLTTRNGK